MDLHSVKATDWIYDPDLRQTAEEIRAHFRIPESGWNPAIALMREHGVIDQPLLEPNLIRFTIPADCPEHVVALTLAVVDADVAAAIAIVESCGEPTGS
jgi:hypothetical protein